MGDKNILGYLFPYPRFVPAILAIFIGGVLLLFIQNLGENVKTFLIPSIFVYAMMATLVGTYHRFLGLHYFKPKIIVRTFDSDYGLMIIELDIKKDNCKRKLMVDNKVELPGIYVNAIDLGNNEKPIPKGWKASIWIAHLVLFASFIIYNFHHCSLSW